MASLMRRLAGESRSITSAGTLSNPSPELTAALTGGNFGPSYTGKSVTPNNAMSLIAVYACINILASIIGSLPCELFARTDAGPERVTDTPLANLLDGEANAEMSSGELFELVMVHLCLHGNAYLYKDRDKVGRVIALWPMIPTRVQVRRDPATQAKEFWIQSTTGGGAFRGTERDVLHIRNLGVDGLVGLSPIGMARQSLGIYAAHEEYQGTFYRNGAQPGGVITIPQGRQLDEPGIKELRAAWEGNHKGIPMAGRVGILQDGQTFQELSISMADQQFIDQQHFSIGQVCNLFNLPKWALGESTGDSLTYATVEQQSDYLTTFSLAVWPVRIQRNLHRDGDVFTDPSQYCRFNLDELKRAAMKDRFVAYTDAINAGWMGRSEIRKREDLPAVASLQEFGPLPDPTKTVPR